MKNNRIIKREMLVFLLLILGLSSVYAQQPEVKNPVKWNFSSEKIENNTFKLIFSAKIDKGWHLYSHDMEQGGPIATNIVYDDISPIVEKKEIKTNIKPREKYDELFGMTIKDFSDAVTFSQVVTVKGSGDIKFSGFVEYMVCDDNMCLPPAEADFTFNVNVGEPKNNVTDYKSTQKIEEQHEEEVTEKPAIVLDIAVNDSLKQIDSVKEAATQSIQPTDVSAEIVAIENPNDITNKSLWWLFGFSFIAGLMAILTPCVFPMIPMTVSFFMKDEKGSNKFQALVYGASIIGIYTIIGTLVAVTLGANFANWLSTHWIPNILFFLIFLVFAASFLGMFEITLPSSWVNKMDSNADKGGIVGSFFMAFTLVLVSFSCTGPLVGAILVESAGGAVAEPIIGMLGFSLAFALPFTFFAFFPSLLKNLPKSGGWLNSVKVILGFVELALGLKFLSVADQTYHWGILDREIYIAFWIVIFSLMGLYLLGKLKFSHDSDLPYVSVPRLAMAIVTFAFVVYLVPGMFGAPLKSLAGYLPPQNTHDFDINQVVRDCSTGMMDSHKNSTLCDKPKHADILHLPHGLEGYFDFEQGIECAKEQDKPLFLVFTGHGCVNCREMEATVWSDPKVLQRLQDDFVIVALYVDDKKKLPESDWVTSEYDGKVKKSIGKINADFQVAKYGVNAQPYYLLLDKDGNLLVSPRAYDLDIDGFIDYLDSGKREYKKRK